jgi:hypothetical protein
MRRLKWVVAGLFAGFGLSAAPAWAWGALGHQAVGWVADARLSAKAREGVNALLAQESGATLASVSTWADQVVNRETGPWHYVNFEAGQCGGPPPAACDAGQCVISAIAAQAQALRTAAAPERRLMALKYLVHFAGDVHQPLHAGYAHDKGGNLAQVQFNGRGSNLHRFWDSTLVESLELDAQGLARAALALDEPQAGVSAPSNSTFEPAQWAAESCQLAQAEAFYPSRVVPSDYVQANQAVVLRRIRQAGLRLAAELNRVFEAEPEAAGAPSLRPSKSAAQ